MVTVTVEKSYGAATVRARVTAPSIEEAVRRLGAGARLVSPIDPRAFFAPEGAPQGVETIPGEPCTSAAVAA